MATLHLIDGSGYIFRAYYAIRHLSTRTGIPTNATYGFTTMIMKLIKEEKPTHLAIAFDLSKPTFRDAIYSEYKAHRPPAPESLPPQIPWIHRIVEAFRIPRLLLEGFEADDLIATLAHRVETDEEVKIVVVSGDKDLLQLVAPPRITMYDPMKGKRFGLAEVAERFGVAPDRIRDVLALMGDTSDNVPGVSGIGEKTAISLVQTHGSLEEVLAAAQTMKPGKLRDNLLAEAAEARLSHRLVTLADDIPAHEPEARAETCKDGRLDRRLESYRYQGPDFQPLRKILIELEFTKLVRDVTPEATISFAGHQTIRSAEAFEAMLVELSSAPRVAISPESEDGTQHGALCGIALAAQADRSYYIPLDHRHPSAGPGLSSDAALAKLRPLLEDRTRPKIVADYKRARLLLQRRGVSLAGVTLDTMLASYLLMPDRKSHGLHDLAQEHFGHDKPALDALLKDALTTAKGKKTKKVAPVMADLVPQLPATAPAQAQTDLFGAPLGAAAPVSTLARGATLTFGDLPIDRATRHSAENAQLLLLLAAPLEAELGEKNMAPLLADLELPLSEMLARMEERGIAVDGNELRTLAAACEADMQERSARIFAIAGHEFNLNSAQQLAEILFDELKLQPGRKTRSGRSTDSDVLEQLASEHPLPREMLEYRAVQKLKSTYTDTLPALVDAQGRVHTTFNQAVAATGRLSSSDPNLQNIPVRTELGRKIRHAFRAPPGRLLIACDYSQIELRLLAHFAQDPILIDAFQRGEDVHVRTAREMFHLAPDGVTPDHRRQAKTLNFGLMYGMSTFGLAKELGISREQAFEIRDKYFQRYAGVARYMQSSVVEAKERGFARTLFGRRRPLPDLRQSDRFVRAASERMAINTPIQGTAADIIKRAMLRAEMRLMEHPDSFLVLQVHDELVIEAPAEDAPRIGAIVKEAMERDDGITLAVPLVVDVGIAPNWGAAH